MCFSEFVRHVLSKICHYDQKHTFFPILHIFAPLKDVRVYIAYSWKTTLITWIFFTRMISNFKHKWPPGAYYKMLFYDKLLINWCFNPDSREFAIYTLYATAT